MGPLRTSINDSAINSKCADQVARVIKQEMIDETDHNNDDQVLNSFIKREIIDKTDYINDDQVFKCENIVKTEHNDDQFLQKETRCQFKEEVNKTETKIKVEKDFIKDHEFDGTVFNENHSSKFIALMNFDKKSNSRKKPLTFSECNKPVTNSFKSQVHKKFHTEHKYHKCNICDKVLCSEASLISHMEIHDSKRKKSFVCNICDSSYNRKSSVERHMKSHSGEKPYKCDLCDKSFSRGFSLKVHIRTHTGERPYRCDFCDTAFSQIGNLKTHKMSKHTGERPYECSICKRTFSRAELLKKHMKTHMGKMPF